MNKNFKVVALGGLGENGKNTYILESDKSIIVFDCGLSNFANKALGIDFVLPDFSYLINNKKKIKGIFISHGHLDQMGGLKNLLSELAIDVPVYGSNYTISFLKTYIDPEQFHLLHEIKYNDVIECGDFSVESFTLAHAVFGNLGFVASMQGEAVVYVTDYNFNQMTSKFAQTDIKKIVQISEKYHIKALLTETVSVDQRGMAGSFQDYLIHFKRFVESVTGRIIITLYSSNLSGMKNVIDIANEYNKKIVIVGRDLLTYVNIAKEYGYIENTKDIFIRIADIKKYDDSELIIVIAGLFADPFIEINKMATKTHTIIQLKDTDNVLIASKAYDEIEAMAQSVMDSISLAGASITHQKINVASHAHEEDIKMMINLFNPEYIVPIKGEYRKFMHFKEVAKTIGFDDSKIKILQNGEFLHVQNGEAFVGEKFKLQNQLLSEENDGVTNPIIITDREILSENGYVLVIISFYKNTRQVVQEPEIRSGGLIHFDDDVNLMEGCLNVVKKQLEQDYDNRELVSKIKIKLTRYLNNQIGKTPMVLPVRVEIDHKPV